MKTFIIEEHHEAFYIWNEAVSSELIPPSGNMLLHVDEHSDMGTPRLNRSLEGSFSDADDLRQFTYEELGIASFIVPAAYQGIIDKVLWVKQKHRKPDAQKEDMFVTSLNHAGKKLISGKIRDHSINGDLDTRRFEYHKIHEKDLEEPESPVILDIDLDYFSCSGNPNENEEIEIEITEEEYRKYNTNKYHRINYVGIPKLITEEREGKYYYVFNYYNELYPSELTVSEQQISERINHFIETLKANKVNPKFIDICRSRYSGYTPHDQWEYIENQLIEGLGQLYDLEISHLK